MKKLIILLMAGCLISLAAHAQNAVIIQMKDGTKNVIALENIQGGQSPTIAFEGNELVVTSSHTLRLDMSKVLRYTFGDYATGIHETGNHTAEVVFLGGDIKISNQPASTRAKIFNASGVLMRSIEVGNTTAQITLNGLPAGVYILKVGCTTYKILKP